MSQSSYTIANAAGSAVRSALNTLFGAIRTKNSGNDAPSETSKFMDWVEEDTNTLWMRNAADDGWLKMGDTTKAFLGLADLATAQEFTKAQNFDATTLTFDATQDWDLSANQVTTLTLTANTTFDAPTSMKDGAFYAIQIKQNATGGYTVAWNAVFKFPGGTAPVITSAANAVDDLLFRSDGTNMNLVGLNQNQS